jgi:tetratricopeptide (TPR) repeat protein
MPASRSPARAGARTFARARALFRSRKFTDVIRLLEPEVFRHREDVDYFRLLGLACLHAGDLGGAFSYLSRAGQLHEDDLESRLGLAAIHLRRGENDRALKAWLSIVETHPANRTARRGLDLLRRGVTPDSLQELVDTGRVKSLYPPLPSSRRFIRVLAVIAVVAVLAGVAYVVSRLIPPRAETRPGVAVIEIPDDLPRLVDAGSDFPFVLSERDVRNEFARAKNELLAWRDNRAAVAINRILLSNATSAVKERARMLKGFITAATFDTLRDAYSYETVRTQPGLYDGCTVRWRGKIANLVVGKSAITFDLLVGYDQERELQGIVPVSLAFATDLQNGAALEVLGQVVSVGGSLSLNGTAVHRLTSP